MKQPLLLLFLIMAASAGAPCQNPATPFRYVAHRGASYLAPENTLASIELAWELGADAAECDVMLTADRQVILFHDRNAKKLTGEDMEIASSSWEQLRRLTILPKETHLKEYTGESIPLLKEVLATVPDDRMLVIEIKTGPEIMPYLEETVRKHWKTGSISFIAFDLDAVRAARKAFPEVPCYYLSMFRRDLNRHFEAVLQAALDGVDLRHGMINRKVMKKCHSAGLEVWCWTVNDPDTALKMKELGVTAVTTDRPAWLKLKISSHTGNH